MVGLKNRKHGHVDDKLSCLLSYTVHLFSQFSISHDSLLQTPSCILICCFNFFMSRSEFKKTKFNFTHEILEISKWGGVGKIFKS